MNVRLGKLEAWVQERVDSGDYASHAEVIRAGLRLLKEDEQWRAAARRKIAEGLVDLQADRVAEGLDVVAEVTDAIARKRGRRA